MAEIEQKFKVGDVVTLKSGSPKMTVSEINYKLRYGTGNVDVFTGFVNCTWFLEDVLKEATFHQDVLQTE